jgi:hypothetical protein
MTKRTHERVQATLTAVLVLVVLVVAALVVAITGQTDGLAAFGGLVAAVLGIVAAVRPRSGE